MQHDTKPKPSVLGAETAKVADLVSYQEGSIASREILKKPTGTVTVFAFDEGQGLSNGPPGYKAIQLHGPARVVSGPGSSSQPARRYGVIAPGLARFQATRGGITIDYTMYDATSPTDPFRTYYGFENHNNFDIEVDLDFGGQNQTIFVAANSTYSLKRSDNALLNIGRIRHAQ